MTLNEFITKYSGKKLDWDNAYGGQCVDLFRFFVDEVLGLPQPKGVVGAADFWLNYDSDPILKNNFDKIPNTPDFKPIAYDVMIWNKKMGGGFGHIGVVADNKATLDEFTSFDQNFRAINVCELTKHTYSSTYGVLRPKKITMPDELQKVLGHYNVKTADELILMVDKEFGFLKSGRETIVKLETLTKTQKADLEALQLIKDSLKIKLDGVEAEKDNAKQMFRDLIDKMALTVGTVADEGAIIKKITSDVTELDLAQKEVKKVTEELNKYRNEKETEILNLKREIQELRADLYKKDVQLTNLSKRIDDLEKLPPVTPKESLLDRIKKEIEVILSIIRKA